jgi:RND family efflux transporter MFP subunit
MANDARTVEMRPRPETVRAAQQRLRDADEAVQVAAVQAAQAEVRAPYNGTVTEVLAEVGAPVTPGSGVVRLAMTARPEIKVSVDEDRLPDLRPGLRAVVTSAAFPKVRLEAMVSRVAASVDNARGTVEVTVRPSSGDAVRNWLRPGQTVNVNLILREGRRLVVPTTAVKREGERSIALVLENGRAIARPVTVGDVEGRLVPVSGLKPDDIVLTDVLAAAPGARVRARGHSDRNVTP